MKQPGINVDAKQILELPEKEFEVTVFSILMDLTAKIKKIHIDVGYVQLGLETLKQNQKKREITKTV